MRHSPLRSDPEDVAFQRMIDNAIIGMSLLVMRSMLKRVKTPGWVRGKLAARMDELIKQYASEWNQNMTIVHDAQWEAK